MKWLKLYCPIAYIIGDNKSHDVLDGRVMLNGQERPRLSRRCLTSFTESNNSYHCCNKVKPWIICKLCMGALGCIHGAKTVEVSNNEVTSSVNLSPNYDKWCLLIDGLKNKSLKHIHKKFRKLRESISDQILHKVLGYHALDNAFYNIDFGEGGSVHRSTVADDLHTIREGIIVMVLKVVFGLMSDGNRSHLDSYVKNLFGEKHNKSSYKDHYPRLNFTRGYSNLTLLNAES